MKCVLILISLIAVGESCHAQKPKDKTVSSIEKVEIEKLIEQLSSPSFQMRRDASLKLMRKGEAILPILKGALKINRNPETKKRLKSLIIDISIFETEQILKQLVKSPDSIPKGRLPFLSEYMKLIGKDTISLEYYIAMYRREKKLFHYELKGTKFRAAVEERIEKFYQSVNGRIQAGNENATENLCAFFFLLSETKPIVSHKMNFYLYSLAYHGSLPRTLSERKESPAKKIIALWIQKGVSAHPYQKASLALEFNLKEGLEPALNVLKNRMKSGTLITSALSVVAIFGSKSDVSTLEERFDDEAKLSALPRNDAPHYECLTKDFALLAAILASRQKPKAYGFRHLWNNPTGFYNSSSAGFDTEEDRKIAFQKWNVWKKKNFQPVKKIKLTKLIDQLGSSSFRERRMASRKLTSRGNTILPVLQSALATQNPEVKKRLEILIRDIQLLESERFLKQLVENPDSVPAGQFPFLQEFRKSIGEDKKSLEFYAAMYRAEKELFHLHKNKIKYKAKTEEVIGELQEAYRINNQQGNDEVMAKICAVIFLQSVTKPHVSPTMQSYVYSLTYYQDLQKILRAKTVSPERKLIALWIRRGEAQNPYFKTIIALQYDIKEGLEPALEMLDDRKLTSSTSMYPLLVIAKFGSKKHIRALEKHFDNEIVQFGQSGNGVPATYRCLLKDTALLSAILVSKQKPEAYGFCNLKKNSTFLYNPGTTGFDTEKDRKAAFKKWKAWKKKNLTAKAKQ